MKRSPSLFTKMLLVLSLVAIGALALAGTASAASTLYWDGGTADILTDGDGASNGGAGTWNVALTNWDAGVAPHVAWVNANDDTAIFGGGAAGTVSLGAAISANALTFSTTGYLVQTNTLTLSGTTPTITTDPGVSATISSAIDGSSGLTKAGAGTLTLSGTNIYTGGTTVSAGTLLTTAATALSNYGSPAQVVFSGGTIGVRVGGAGWSTAQVDTLLTNATKTSGALGIDTTNGNVNQWTPFTTTNFGGLGLTKMGGNTLTLNQVNTYTGKTSVLAGTLLLGTTVYLSNAGVAGPLGAPTGADATIDMYNGTTLQMGSTVPRKKQITDRTINLAGNGAGTVKIRVNDNDTLFQFGAVTATGTGPKTLALYTASTSGNGDREAVVFNGVISDGDSPLSLQVTSHEGSANYVSIPAANTFTGSITLSTENARTYLYLTVGGMGPSQGAGSYSYTPGSGSLASGDYAGTISLGTKTTFSYASSADQILSGAITGNGALIKAGSGTLTLSGAYAYTGATTVNGGTLILNMNGGGSLTAASALTLNSGTTLALVGKDGEASAQTFNNLTLSATASGGSFGISSTGGASGTMDLTLPGTWTRGKAVTMNVGLGTGGTLYSNPATANTLVVGTGNVAYATVNGTDWAKVDSTGTPKVVAFVAGDYTVGLPASGSDGAVNYSHTDNASVTASEAVNTLKLDTSTTGQALTIDPGQTLTLNAGGLLFVGADNYGITGGTLKGSGGTQKELVVHQYGDGNLTIGSVIADNGAATALVKAGTGTLTLTNAANSFTGNTYLNGGTLNINAVGALPLNSVLYLNDGTTIGNTSGARLNLTGKHNNPQLNGTITFNGSATDTSKDLYFSNVSQSGDCNITLLGNTTFNVTAGILNIGTQSSGAYSITKEGPGELQLGNSNNVMNFSGGLYVNEGTWTGCGNDNATTYGTTTVYLGDTTAGNTKNAALAYKSGGYVNSNNSKAIAANNLIVRAGSSGSLAFIDGAGWNGTSFYVGNHGLNGTVTLNNNLTVAAVAATNQTTTLAGAIGGAGNLRIGELANVTDAGGTQLRINLGTVILSAANTFTGDTIVNTGTLRLANVNALQASTLDTGTAGAQQVTFAVTGTNTYNLGGLKGTDNLALVTNSISVGGNNVSTEYTGIISSTGGLAKVGTGTLTLSGANLYSGATTVNGGMLTVAATGSIANSSAIAIGSAGTLDVSANPLTLTTGKTMSANGTVIGNLTVNEGASLTGNASLVGSTTGQSITVNGLIGPGTYGAAAATDGVGTLTVGDGSYDVALHLGSTSVYNWGLSPDGQGLINVTGDVTIDSGAKVLVHNAGEGSPAGDHTILTWTGADPANLPTTIEYAAAPSGTAVNWIGAGSPPTQEWDTTTNWDLGSYTGGSITQVGKSLVLSGLSVVSTTPLSTSAVTIAPVGGVTVNGPSVGTTVQSLAIGNGTDTTSLNLVPGVAFGVTAATTVNTNASLTVDGTLTTASLTTTGTVGVSGTGSLGTSGSPVATVAINGGETTFATGAAVHANAIAVNAGTLNVADGAQLAGPLTLAGGTLKTTAGITSAGSLNVASAGGTIDTNTFDSAISGAISGTGSLTKAGTGALSLSGTGSLGSATTTVTGGKLVATAAILGGSVALSNNANLTFNQSADGAYSKSISGNGSLTKEGSGTLMVGAAQSYDGPTVISGGIMKLGGAAPVSGMNAWYDASQGVTLSGTTVTGWADQSTNGHDATVGSGTPQLASSQINGQPAVLFRNNDLTIQSNITPQQEYIVFKSGTGSNNWGNDWGGPIGQQNDNGWMFQSGTRQMWNDGARTPLAVSQNGTAIVQNNPNGNPYGLANVANYMILKVNPKNFAPAFGRIGRPNNSWGNSLLDVAEILIYDHVLSPTEEAQVGTYLGTKYNISNSYTPTFVAGNDFLPTTSALSIASGAALDLFGGQQTVASLSDSNGGGGSVINSGAAAATLTLNPAGGSTTFSGVIGGGVGTINLIKDGSGTQILTGPNTYTGDTTVEDGTLSITTLGSLDDASTVTIFDNATAYLDLAFTGIDQVGELYLGATLMGPGVYGSFNRPGYFTGTGKVKVGSTVPGDADGNGIVDASDYIWIKQHFGEDALTATAEGGNDLDGSGTIDWGDLQVLMGAVAGAPPVQTPEPATLGLLAIGALAVLKRKRK